MEKIIINKSSWHYRYMELLDVHPWCGYTGGVCQYARRMVIAFVATVFIVALTSLVVISICMGAYAMGNEVYGIENAFIALLAGLFSIVFFVVVILSVIVGIIALINNIKKRSDLAKEERRTQELNGVVFKESLFDKICRDIEIVD